MAEQTRTSQGVTAPGKQQEDEQKRQRRVWPGTIYTIVPQKVRGITEELPWQQK
jgi:hypothetical protein